MWGPHKSRSASTVPSRWDDLPVRERSCEYRYLCYSASEGRVGRHSPESSAARSSSDPAVCGSLGSRRARSRDALQLTHALNSTCSMRRGLM